VCGQTSIKGQDCARPLKREIEVLINSYPFSKAYRLQLAEFEAPNKIEYGINKPWFSWDTTDFIPKKNGTVDTSKFIHRVDMSKAGIDSLIKIIGTKSKKKNAVESNFIEPRYAIIFYDEKNMIYDYIVFNITDDGQDNPVIGTRGKTIIGLGDYCPEKYKLLIDFYKMYGIEVRIVKY